MPSMLHLCFQNVALVKQDKAGLITFSEEPRKFPGGNRKATQMNTILEVLYKQKTRYLESDFDKLYTLIRQQDHAEKPAGAVHQF